MMPFSILKSLQRLTILCIVTCFSVEGFGQSLTRLTLEEAYTLLEENYPSLQNDQLINEMYSKELEKLSTNRLPSIFLKADGRLQSESVGLDTEGGPPLPFEIDLPLYAAKGYFEVNYLLLDGGMTSALQEQTEAKLKADLQSLEVDRYALRNRINTLFTTISTLRDQGRLFDITLDDLEKRKDQMQARVDNGIALSTDVNRIEVNQLKIEGLQMDLKYKLNGLISTLSYLLGNPVSQEVDLIYPDFSSLSLPAEISRPELTLFDEKKNVISASESLIDAQRAPKLSLMAQGGVGTPNPLNLLDNEPAPYGLLGAQFSWKIVDWKRSKMDRSILKLKEAQLNNAKETFQFNLDSKTATYQAEKERLTDQIRREQRITEMQATIREKMAAQLDEGMITSVDYMIQVNEEIRSKQNLILHQTELLKIQLEYFTERGSL